MKGGCPDDDWGNPSDDKLAGAFADDRCWTYPNYPKRAALRRVSDRLCGQALIKLTHLTSKLLDLCFQCMHLSL